MFELTENAQRQSERQNLNPNLVLEIEGVTDKYGVVNIKKYIRVGDDDLLIGDDWVIGGLRNITNQLSAISFDGTTSEISQQLNPDKGSGSSVPSMAIALVDIDSQITELISPGFVVEDLLARKATVWLGFEDTAFPDDYIRIFRGIIDDIISIPGKITLNIAHPEQKKRQDIYLKAESELDGSITNSQTTIDIVDTTNFLEKITGPDLTVDSSFRHYIRIDDEIIEYDAISVNQFTGCTRGALGTVAAAHNDEASVESFYRLTGNSMDLALKLMLSGWNDYFKEDIPFKAFNQISPTETVANSIFFYATDPTLDYGVAIGDFITTTGATNGANNVTLKEVIDIQHTSDGVYLVIDGVSFVTEDSTAALLKIRSQYDTLPDGLKLSGDEVDVDQHNNIKRLFLSSFDYDFYIKDTINGKDFIDQEIYFPAAAYSIPRKAASSVGYHIGPIPSSQIKLLDYQNVARASGMPIRRTITKNFYNTVVYKFEEDTLEEKFLDGALSVDETSKARIPVGTKALIIKSKGMRSDLNGFNLASTAATRRLNRYKFASEFLDQVNVLYGESYNVEIGDIMILSNSNLKISNTATGDRGDFTRFFEVVNKRLSIKTGAVVLSLVDTNFNGSARYCLISPASLISSGISTTQFQITETGNSPFGAAEYQKWKRYTDVGTVVVRIRSDDFTTHNETTTITNIAGNLITVSPALSFTPSVGDRMTFSTYNDMNDQLKMIYCFMRDTDPFDDGRPLYQML